MMDAGAVREIANLAAKPGVVSVNGLEYLMTPKGYGTWEASGGTLGWAGDPNTVLATLPDALIVGTLQGLIDYALMNPDDIKHETFVQVQDKRTVSLMSSLFSNAQRITHIKAHVNEKTNGFPWGQYLTAEDAVIAIRRFLMETPDRDEILGIISNLRAETVVRGEDDGLTQMVTVSKKTMAERKSTKPTYELIPSGLTFPDISIPVLPCILRFTGGGGEKVPNVAIFPGDWSAWNEMVIAEIRIRLRMALAEWTIIG